ncbi:hypothetical protein M409DRAFT_19984 [Zasmidium cellare ATCC 36951]|uniref:BTB domain-containing protein n=1 Tax=Zasmidium cellare ATCC 36951 TaxID=1080233 RepID=A0A6A6CS90_ZASCE|nr:uncharacterized protein M409DRAFT_19984 [Zasmidium cellare ATCC 36951]KAF2169573.1 hypothetical protein M409DRAFT_19984 [Zasmidium cellare ATCC 36951]
MSQMGLHRSALDGMIEFQTLGVVKIRLSTSNRTEFLVHRSVICRSSEVLRKTFSTSHEHKAATTLTDIAPFDVKVYLNWLYTGVLHTKCEEANIGTAADNEYESLVDGYLLGIKLEDRKYCNTTISAMLDKAEQCSGKDIEVLPKTRCVNKADVTNGRFDDGWRLQDVLVEIFARSGNLATLWDALEDKALSHRFFQKLVSTLVEVCNFHEHEGDEKCSAQEPSRKRRREE